MVVTIAVLFFLIEKMAIHLQDLFENKPTDIPVIAVAYIIDHNLRQIINDQKVPKTVPAESFYVL